MKIVSAAEMRRIEKLAAPSKEGEFMDKAAEGLPALPRHLSMQTIFPNGFSCSPAKGIMEATPTLPAQFC